MSSDVTAMIRPSLQRAERREVFRIFFLYVLLRDLNTWLITLMKKTAEKTFEFTRNHDKKPPLLWEQISYCWPLTAWNSKGNHHRLSSQCECFKRRAISSSRRHDFTQSSAKMIFDWIYLNLFIYWNKNTTGKEIANWNVMFGTVAIQMSILDTNFPRFCLANIWTGSNLSVTATWSPKVTYRIYFQLSDRGQEATLDRTVVFVILICVFF